ncbi:MAG TPA: SDR family oxidoreductase [Tepidisphaeraceae bacterium]|nr:SDR family oxidoreductase [Tepidisphaeraceae bacterium]
MKVLVTGTDGYIGTLLGPLLMERGHEVTGVDTGFHRIGWLYNGVQKMPMTITKDIRNLTEQDLKGFDAIVHLAELSNDPVGELSRHITYDINHKGTIALAEKAKKVGAKRFVYFSSCSVYGASSTHASDEHGKTNPLTAYAECKLLVENDLKPMADSSFSPTYLRNATAYGASPRQRFDLVVNNLCGHAWCSKLIKMDSDGTPWRPLVHALDICQAAACVLDAPKDVIHNETFNVGDNNENYQVKDVAKIVADTFPGCELQIGTRGDDKRDYKVNFDKINTKLPGFKCKWTVAKGAQQLLKIFQQIGMPKDLFESKSHTRLKQIQHLIATKQIDKDFFWVN